MRSMVTVFALVAGLGGCAVAPDPKLEQALLLNPAATAPARPQPGVQAPPGPRVPAAMPARVQAVPRYDRVLNLDPVHLTNNAYGPGRSSDAYGRLVLHDAGQVITRVPGKTHSYEDQYGRPVRCYGAGAETICQ